MGEAINAVGRFSSEPFLAKLEDKMAAQLTRDTERAVELMAETERSDLFGQAIVEAQTKASAGAIKGLGPQKAGKVTQERWLEIEGKLKTAFYRGLAEMKETML